MGHDRPMADVSLLRKRLTPLLLRPGAVVFVLILLLALGVTRARLLAWEARLPGEELPFTGRILDAGSALPGGEEGRTQLVLLADGTPVMLWVKEVGRKGDLVQGRACFECGQGSRNPGGFSKRNWLWSKGAAWTASTQAIRIIPQDHVGLWLARLPDRLRDYVRLAYADFWQSLPGPLLLSLTLGDSRLMTDQQTYWLRTAGLSHLTSVSGTHLLFILDPFRSLSVRAGMSRRTRRLMTLPLIVLPGVLSGWKSGICRAALMALASELDGPLGQHRHAFNSLFWAASLILVLHPYALYDTGYWMSLTTAAAVSGVAGGGRGPIRRSLRFSLAAQTVILPYQMMSAPGFHLLAPLANLLALPLAAYMMAASYLCLALMSLVPSGLPLAGRLSGFCSSLLAPVARLFEWIAHKLASCARAFIPIKWLLLVLPPVLALAFFYRRQGRPKKGGGKTWPVLAGLWLLLVLLFFLPEGSHQILFLDVGQGDASLILTRKGQSLLIDGGDQGHGYQTIIPAARMQGLAAIDLAIVTHGHSDHALGLVELMEAGFIRHLCLPAYEGAGRPEDPEDLTGLLLEEARLQGLPVSFLKKGDRLDGKDFCLEVLYPDQVPETGDLNRYSLVLKLTLDDFTVLMTGDLTAEGEASLLRAGSDCSADLLHLAHHGSGSSSTPNFLDACAPQAALISLAAKNRYGHPHPDVLDRLADRAITVIRTDQSGAVFLKIGQGKGRIRTWISEAGDRPERR